MAPPSCGATATAGFPVKSRYSPVPAAAAPTPKHTSAASEDDFTLSFADV